MDNQKICCESGRVRVSYKIPVSRFFTNNYTLFKANIKKTFVYSDRSRETGTPYTGREEVSYSVFPPVPTGSTGLNYYLKAPIELGFYSRSMGVYENIGSININLPKKEWIGKDDQKIYFIGGRVSNSNKFLYEYLVGGSSGPTLHKYRCEVLGYTNFPYLDGDCSYPTEWKYLDLETFKIDVPFIEKLPVKFLKKFSPLQAIRQCVQAYPDLIYNPNKIILKKSLEILVSLEVGGVTIKKQWEPIPGFDGFIELPQPLISPTGCPPPLVKIECCPETGCDEKCPEGTCPVDCGDYICCYNKQGKSVKRISK